MVGDYASHIFKDVELLSPGKEALDVTHPHKVMQVIREFRPEVIVHLAGATDVDRCEQEPEWAFRINSIGTHNVALACQKYNIIMVYVSSGAVFSGDKPEPYTEFDPPNPANVYGRSKLAGEQIVSTLLREFYIIRGGWMFGGGSRDKKFVGKIASILASDVKELRVVDDKFGSPTYALDLLGGIARLLPGAQFGLYHLVNSGSCSRYEIALEMQRVMKMTKTDIIPVSSAYFPLPAPRGRSEALQNYKLQLLGIQDQRPWREALEDYLRSEFLPSLSERPHA